MRIIQSGNHEKQLNTIKCNKCNCVVECEADELEFVSDWRDGDFYWFKCPECSHKKAISAKEIK